MRYRIVAADTADLLAELVNEQLALGASLTGGVCVYTLPNKMPLLLQAMTMPRSSPLTEPL